MKTIIAAGVGFIVGFIAGIALSELIGIAGYLLTGEAVGIKYLSLYLAVAFAIVAPAGRAWVARRSK